MEISTQELSKVYRSTVALDRVSFTINTGLVGILGPNGAGKTTLLNILATLIEPTSGQILVDGLDIRKQKQRVRQVLGFLPQEFDLYGNLTAFEFLDYMAVLKGIPNRKKEVERALETAGLRSVAYKRLRTFSGGMKQRTGIAQAILNSPSLLIVDEPTVGLDPEERSRFRQLLTQLAINATVILSTHLVEDIAAATNHVIVINHGKLIFHGSVKEVMNNANGKVWRCFIPKSELPSLQQKYKVLNVEIMESQLEVRFFATHCNDPIAEAVSPSLEEGYLSLISENNNESFP